MCTPQRRPAHAEFPDAAVLLRLRPPSALRSALVYKACDLYCLIYAIAHDVSRRSEQEREPKLANFSGKAVKLLSKDVRIRRQELCDKGQLNLQWKGHVGQLIE